MITNRNWNTGFFQKENMISFISMGADPTGDHLLYFVTTTDPDRHIEHFQEEYEKLEWALETINARFGHWSFVDLENQAHGCSC